MLTCKSRAFVYLILRGDMESSTPDGEAAPKLLGGNVCAVLHSDVLLNGADQSPELLLHQLCGHHLTNRETEKPLPQLISTTGGVWMS